MNSNQTVLVADDSRSVRVHVKQRLQDAGFTVVLAENGKVALEQIVERRPDVAVLDINMPELDGYGVCERLEAMSVSVPIIFLTGVEANAVKMLGDKLGAYLTKPVCGETLVQTVHDVLSVHAEQAQRRICP